MSSAFKDAVDAGWSELESLNSDLGSVSLSNDPDSFANAASLAGRADFADRMRSAFGRMGENLHDDAQSWARNWGQKLSDRCDAIRTTADRLVETAGSAQRAASQLKDMGDPGDDEDKKSQVEAAQENVTEGTSETQHAIEMVRTALLNLHDDVRSANGEFKDRIAQAKSLVDQGMGPVNQLNDSLRSLEDQISGKVGEQKSLMEQLNSQMQTQRDLAAKKADKLQREKDADAKLNDGAKQDPPLSMSDLQGLEQAAASARKEREQAEADEASYYEQTVMATMTAVRAKGQEWKPLEDQRAQLKQQRDQQIEALNKARIALTDLSKEYEEPSL